MGYKTILTVLTDTNQQAQLEAAVTIARQHDAHLDVFCLAVDHTQSGFYYAGASAYVFQAAIEAAMETARELEDWAKARLEGSGVRYAVESAVAQGGGLATLVAMRARFCDLAVMNRPYDGNYGADRESVVEGALFDGICPVLIVPDQVSERLGQRILVAWNQSNEALAAIRRALPLLCAADHVEITVIDPSPHGPERAEPGKALARMLSRHGVRAEIAVLARTQSQISAILMQRATEIGADMVVMGAYGQSRLREAILGGATRDLLEGTSVPIFMAR